MLFKMIAQSICCQDELKEMDMILHRLYNFFTLTTAVHYCVSRKYQSIIQLTYEVS